VQLKEVFVQVLEVEDLEGFAGRIDLAMQVIEDEHRDATLRVVLEKRRGEDASGRQVVASDDGADLEG
jgi:hypothetical protein